MRKIFDTFRKKNDSFYEFDESGFDVDEDDVSKLKKENAMLKKENNKLKENFAQSSIDSLKKRRSIRHFSDRSFDIKIIYDIIDAGMNAPCAGSIQNYKIIIISDKKAKEECAKIAFQQYFIVNAPYVLLIVRDNLPIETVYPDKYELFSIQNTSALIENIIVGATAFDLGSCWIGLDDSNALKEYLKIPADMHLDALIPIGYPDETPKAPRKADIEGIIYFDKYGNKKK